MFYYIQVIYLTLNIYGNKIRECAHKFKAQLKAKTLPKTRKILARMAKTWNITAKNQLEFQIDDCNVGPHVLWQRKSHLKIFKIYSHCVAGLFLAHTVVVWKF